MGDLKLPVIQRDLDFEGVGINLFHSKGAASFSFFFCLGFVL